MNMGRNKGFLKQIVVFQIAQNCIKLCNYAEIIYIKNYVKGNCKFVNYSLKNKLIGFPIQSFGC